MPPRLLRTLPLPAALNMALDEVLLRGVGEHGPVVRLYQWQPGALSLGYAQPVADADRDALARHGLELTRRITGGRAVLHHDEITYSVCVPGDLLNVGRSVTRAYGALSGALSDALARLGVPAGCTPRSLPEQSSTRDPACFATTLGGDLAVAGRKLVGSAQCHRYGGILQHGAIPIHAHEVLLAEVLRRPPTAERHWTCLAELGVAPDLEAFAAAFAQGFAPLLGGALVMAEPTAEEWAAAEALAAEKYRSAAWVERL